MSSVELEKQYQKKTDKEHILDNPDTYIGSVENVDTTSYIFDETGKIVETIVGAIKWDSVEMINKLKML